MPGMPDFGAMIWVTIASSIVLPIVIIGVVLFVFLRAQGRRTRLQSNGTRARGTVTAVADTGVTINGNPRARFDLLVEPAGGPAFNATATQVVSRLAIPRVGDVVAVRYMPGTSDIMISLAEIPPHA